MLMCHERKGKSPELAQFGCRVSFSCSICIYLFNRDYLNIPVDRFCLNCVITQNQFKIVSRYHIVVDITGKSSFSKQR